MPSFTELPCSSLHSPFIGPCPHSHGGWCEDGPEEGVLQQADEGSGARNDQLDPSHRPVL